MGGSWHAFGQEDILLSKELAGRREETLAAAHCCLLTHLSVRSVIYLGDI